MGWRVFRLRVVGEVLLLVGGACRYNMGNVSAHEAQYAGAAVMVAEVSPRPPRWSGRCARATAVARHIGCVKKGGEAR